MGTVAVWTRRGEGNTGTGWCISDSGSRDGTSWLPAEMRRKEGADRDPGFWFEQVPLLHGHGGQGWKESSRRQSGANWHLDPYEIRSPLIHFPDEVTGSCYSKDFEQGWGSSYSSWQNRLAPGETDSFHWSWARRKHSSWPQSWGEAFKDRNVKAAANVSGDGSLSSASLSLGPYLSSSQRSQACQAVCPMKAAVSLQPALWLWDPARLGLSSQLQLLLPVWPCITIFSATRPRLEPLFSSLLWKLETLKPYEALACPSLGGSLLPASREWALVQTHTYTHTDVHSDTE